MLQIQVGQRSAFVEFPVKQLWAIFCAAILPALPRLPVVEWGHGRAKAAISPRPFGKGWVEFDADAVVASPAGEQFKDGLELRLILRRLVVDREKDGGVGIVPEDCGKLWVTMEKKTIGHEAKGGVGPVLSRQGNKLRELRMNRRLPTEQGKNLRSHPPIPKLHPAVGFLEGDDAFVPVIGIMRATLARQIAGVDKVDFQILNRLHALPRNLPTLQPGNLQFAFRVYSAGPG